MKHNKKIKSILAFILCMVVTFVSIGMEAGAGTVYAAGEKIPMQVGFKGKTVSLIKDLNSTERYATSKLSSVQKKWGKPKKLNNSYYTTFTWKKGKTSIAVIDYPEEVKKDIIGSIEISIKDKNGSLCGVTVGMKKEAAVKKLQKLVGKKRVVVLKKGQQLAIKANGSYTVSGKATGGAVSIRVGAGGYMPISMELKNGKVTSIYWMRS